MGQRSKPNCAVGKEDAQIELSKEEFALSMGQRSKNAAKRDAQNKLEMEEYAGGMGQRSNYATSQEDAQNKHKEEESVGHTAASHPNVVLQDAKVTPIIKEYV